MSTKTFLSLLLVSTIALTSCKKELEPQESSTTPAAASPETANTTATTVAPPVQTQQQNMTAVNTNTVTPVNTAKGMNPAHGQPGHRCDIPVGAPLNSPAAKPTTPPAATQTKQSGNYTVTPAAVNTNGTITPAAATTSATPAILNPTTTAPGMNPPHGQEGHVCSVAVGAPLPKT